MEENKIVELEDENGEVVKFEQLLTFEFEGGLFVAITPVESMDGIENGDVIVLEITEDEDGEDCYLPLEDEDKLDVVYEEFERLYYEEQE